MQYRYIKNLKEKTTTVFTDPSTVTSSKPSFNSKASFRDWCSDATTDHVFYSTVEANNPSLRITNDNPPQAVWGIVGDYDASVDWDIVDDLIKSQCKGHMPTWRSRTQSGYIRLVWEFQSKIPIAPEMFSAFMKRVSIQLDMKGVFAGFDTSSLRPSQYFELG